MNPQATAQERQPLLLIDAILKTTLWTILVFAILSGCAKSPRSFQQMSGDEQLNYLRAQAGQAMLAQATNGVPNIHDVIEENADTFSGTVAEWRGWVRLDFVNPAGAIQQTNIPMAFAATDDGHLFGCIPRDGSALIDIR